MVDEVLYWYFGVERTRCCGVSFGAVFVSLGGLTYPLTLTYVPSVWSGSMTFSGKGVASAYLKGLFLVSSGALLCFTALSFGEKLFLAAFYPRKLVFVWAVFFAPVFVGFSMGTV